MGLCKSIRKFWRRLVGSRSKVDDNASIQCNVHDGDYAVIEEVDDLPFYFDDESDESHVVGYLSEQWRQNIMDFDEDMYKFRHIGNLEEQWNNNILELDYVYKPLDIAFVTEMRQIGVSLYSDYGSEEQDVSGPTIQWKSGDLHFVGFDQQLDKSQHDETWCDCDFCSWIKRQIGWDAEKGYEDIDFWIVLVLSLS